MAKKNTTKGKNDALKNEIEALLKKIEIQNKKEALKERQVNLRQLIYNLRFLNNLARKAYNLDRDHIDIEATLGNILSDDKESLKYALSFQRNSTHTGCYEGFMARCVNGIFWIRIQCSEKPINKDA